MQFLVYITVLMLSISTVLLEVHWLTSPPPQQKPAVQAANTQASASKVEGPNAALSPVYPQKKPVTGESAAGAPQPVPGQPQTQAPATAVVTATTIEPARKTQAETTGMPARAENSRQPAAAPANAAPTRTDKSQAPPAQPTDVASNNRCNVDACASAYRSFRTFDCTYQPFGGERRICTKAAVPVRSAGREPNSEPPATRRSARDVELRGREMERRARLFRDEDDGDDSVEVRDSERDEPSFFLFGGRGRRW